jgi:hypothetical protein
VAQTGLYNKLVCKKTYFFKSEKLGPNPRFSTAFSSHNFTDLNVPRGTLLSVCTPIPFKVLLEDRRKKDKEG